VNSRSLNATSRPQLCSRTFQASLGRSDKIREKDTKTASAAGTDALQVLTVKDVAARLQVPVSWIYDRTRRRGNGRMPHRKLGKYLRFLATEVDDWFRNLPGI
jgi:excisionase family DNA binding protein